MVSAAGECGKVDLVFVTDISGSMVDEFKYLQQNVNIVRNYFDNSCFDTQVSYYHLSERDYTGKFGQITGVDNKTFIVTICSNQKKHIDFSENLLQQPNKENIHVHVLLCRMAWF